MSILTGAAELQAARAVAGRTVRITVPVRDPANVNASARANGIARGRQHLAEFLAGGRTSVSPFPFGGGQDLQVEGELPAAYPNLYNLRAAALGAVQQGAQEAGFQWLGVGPEDVSLQDLDSPEVSHAFADPSSWYAGGADTNPDGTVNYEYVIGAGASEGLANLGEGIGSVVSHVGEAAGGLVGGLLGGLGWKGVLFLLVLFIVAVVVLAVVFGGPQLLMGVARG